MMISVLSPAASSTSRGEAVVEEEEEERRLLPRRNTVRACCDARSRNAAPPQEVEEEEVSRCSVCNWEASNCQCVQGEVMSDNEMSDSEVMMTDESDEVMSDRYMDDDEVTSNEAADEEDRDQEYEDEQRKVRGYTAVTPMHMSNPPHAHIWTRTHALRNTESY
jgi:hypothetical protein